MLMGSKYLRYVCILERETLAIVDQNLLLEIIGLLQHLLLGLHATIPSYQATRIAFADLNTRVIQSH